MKRFGWNIHVRTQLISVGPALLLTVLLTVFFTYERLSELRLEVNHNGQLIADQLAPATEYGVFSGNRPVLEALVRANLKLPHVRSIEVRDHLDRVLVSAGNSDKPSQLELFHAAVKLERVELDADELDFGPPTPAEEQEDYLGRVVVGMSSEAFSTRQQEILLTAGLLALLALTLTYFLARRLAQQLALPISAMSDAVRAIQSGQFQNRLPEVDANELGDLARHINSLARGLAQASQEQRQAILQLTTAREDAEQANRAKSDFLAMMSHELRTPMNGVLGMLQLLETTQMTSEQAEYSALATESTEHLLKVINDILDFSRIERGALELECIPFNFAELVLSSVQVLRHRTEQRGLALAVDIQPGLSQFDVLGDPTRIRQILINLTGNALKFTETGRIRIEVQWRIRDEQHLWLRCAIHDTGIGIDPEELARMFTPFQQADSSISRRYGGTGLGLAIARTLTEHMGGTLNASSALGQGSVFHFELELPYRHRPFASRHPLSPLASDRRTILLLEDDPVNQSVVQGLLHSLGYDVHAVSSGAQAIQAVQRRAIAAILLKCQLSEMDGYQTAQKIRQLNEGRQLPIIALPSADQPSDREACAAAGINDALPMPFKRADLQKILLHWLSPDRGMTGQD